MRHYLDHASTTPLRRAAAEAVSQWASRLGRPDGAGDPGRVHEEGRAVRQAIELAREQVAALAGVSAGRIVFTSGATEAVNTATASVVAAAEPGRPVACAPVEHSSVRLASEAAARVVELSVGADASVDLEQLAELLRRPQATRPALVQCQWANHEVGTVQPVEEVAALCAEAGVPLHVDAAAAFGRLPATLSSLGAPFCSVSAHKLGGPAGVGALVLGRGVRLQPMLLGGSEERGRRAGAENVLGIVGFGAAAAELAGGGRLAREHAEATRRRDALAEAATSVQDVCLLGPPAGGWRLPHLCCVSVGGVLGEAVLVRLDRVGVAAHSGSACSSESFEPSPVLAAMGTDPDRSLRVSVGWSTTAADLEAFAAAFPAVVADLRSLSATSS